MLYVCCVPFYRNELENFFTGKRSQIIEWKKVETFFLSVRDFRQCIIWVILSGKKCKGREKNFFFFISKKDRRRYIRNVMWYKWGQHKLLPFTIEAEKNIFFFAKINFEIVSVINEKVKCSLALSLLVCVIDVKQMF